MIDKVYTSYYYKIRFFKSNMIPISTTMWDPKWFHHNKGNSYLFYDKNNVINGIRYEDFAPSYEVGSICGDKLCDHNPTKCDFLRLYKDQLDKIDINEVVSNLEKLSRVIKIDDPVYVFIVYETPDNKCSERVVIQNYFKSNGIDCEELVI